MSDNRDWQKDKETIKYLQSWRLDPGGTEDAAAFYTIEDHVYTDIKADGMLLEDAWLLNDAFLALEHYHKQYAAEKGRADKESELQLKTWIRAVDAEAREQKLRFALDWAIKEPSNWDDPEDALDEVMAVFRNTLASLYPKEAKA